MLEPLDAFATWMAALPPLSVYAVVLAVAFGENVVPFIPGDVVVVLGGYVVGVSAAAFWPVVTAATIGGTVGFMVMFAVGRHLGEAVLDPERLTWVPKGPARRVQHWIRRWGVGVIVVNRFLSGARAVVALLAGASGMRAGTAAVCSAVSVAVWSVLLVGGGYALGANWPRVLTWLKAYGQVVTGVLVIAGVVGGGFWWRRRREMSKRQPGAEGSSGAATNAEEPGRRGGEDEGAGRTREDPHEDIRGVFR